jgi:hypothetical protein
VEADFETFWRLYPRKAEGKPPAFKAWQKLGTHPTVEEIQATLDWQVGTEAWQRENGRYRPSAAKWLADRRWEVPPPAAAGIPDAIFKPF